MSLIKIKDFNAIFDKKPFSDQEAHKKLVEMSRNDDHTIGNSFYYLYHQNCYKVIGIYLSRQINKIIPQQINFTGKLEEDNGATMLFITKKQQKTILNFSLDLLNVTE